MQHVLRGSRRGPMRVVVLGLAAFALVGAAAAPVAAQETGDAMEDARVHFERGAGLAGEQKWEEALVEFSRSVELYATAPGLLNLGFCLRNVNRRLDALRTFERFLDEFGSTAEPQDLQDANTQIAELRGLLGAFLVRVNFDGAAVQVDERNAGTAPLAEPVYVEPGPHTIVARLGDGTPAEREITVAAGEQLEVELELEQPTVPVGPTSEGPVVAEDDGGVDPVVFWSMVGVTGAAAVAWGVTGGLALAADADYSSNSSRTQADRDSGQALALGADICGGIAIAAVVTTAVLAFFVDWDGESPDESGTPEGEAVGFSVGPVTGGFGLGVAGRF